MNYKRNVTLFYISKFLTSFRFYIPIWIIFGSKFLTISEQGYLEAFTFAVGVLMELPSGAMADLVGRKLSTIIGWALLVISHLGMGFSVLPIHYIIASLFGGLGSAFISGADTALIYDTLKEAGQEKDFSKIQSLGQVYARLAIIFASFTGGMLYEKSQTFPFIGMALTEILGIITMFFMYEPALDTVKFSLNSYISQIKQGLQEINKTKYVRYLSIYYALVGGLTMSSLLFFNYSYALQLGLNENAQSILFGFSGVLKALIVIFVARKINSIKKETVFILFPALMIIFYTFSAFTGIILAIGIILATEIIAAARSVVLDQYVNDKFSSKVRATALSTLNMAISLIYLIVVSLGGFIAQKYSTGLLYSIIGLFTIIAILPVTLKLLHLERH